MRHNIGHSTIYLTSGKVIIELTLIQMVHRALLRRLYEQNEFATLADRRKFSSPCTMLSKCI